MSRSPSPLLLIDERPPPPQSTSSAVAQANRNPFSIDYILSNAAMAKHQPNEVKLKHLNSNQQQQQQQNSSTTLVEQLNSQAQMTQQLQQQYQQQQQTTLYFMACMHIIQQQQQQQQAARQQQIRSSAPPPPPPPPAQVSSSHSASPIDSLALLARLTGSGGLNGNEMQPQFKRSSSGLHRSIASSRRQPYPTAAPAQFNPTFGQQQQQLQQQNLFAAAELRHSPIRPKLRDEPAKPAYQHQFTHHAKGPAAGAGVGERQVVAAASGESGKQHMDNMKPAHSYIGLIGMCILSSAEKRMVLNDIYQHILDHYPYYRNRGSGWRNSVRHNLSLNECFQKAGRAANGKGHYWTIHPANMEDFMNGDFRRRRAQRKVRRFNNMDVPSDESDDESMEDATRPPLPEHFKRSIEMHKQLLASGANNCLSESALNQQHANHEHEFMARVAAMAKAVAPPPPPPAVCLNLCQDNCVSPQRASL